MKPYVLTTPVRNELANLPGLLEHVEALEPRPALWVIVDDSSDDGSRQWLEQQAATRDWMTVCDAPEPANEYLGAHIARLKRWGVERALELATSRGSEVGYAGVLDADIHVGPDHYARLIEAFESDPRLGVVSSMLKVPGAAAVEDWQREDLPRGPTQFFRLECLREIGGIPPWPGFDGVSNVKAKLRGWKTRMLVDVVASHQRHTATRFGAAAGYVKKGHYSYFLGVHPLLVLGRAVAYSSKKPYTAGFHYLRGWGSDLWHRRKRCPDPEIRAYFRKQRVVEVIQALVGSGPRYVK